MRKEKEKLGKRNKGKDIETMEKGIREMCGKTAGIWDKEETGVYKEPRGTDRGSGGSNERERDTDSGKSKKK